MLVDIALKGGRIIDPRENIDKLGDIYIKDQKIINISEDEPVTAECTIDVRDCLVLPGLIDFHTHIFEGGTDSGISSDILPSMGVTTAVDGGSAGSANFDVFYRDVVVRSNVRVKSLLNVSPTGIITRKYPEIVDPNFFDTSKIHKIYKKYHHNIVGLKVRISRDIAGDLGLAPVQAALDLSKQLDCRVVVHTTDPCVSTDKLVKILRKGDVFCHVYHGKGNTIIGNNGKVMPEVKEARQRGVIFDAANGKANYANRIAEAAITDSFLPDIISTDVGALNAFRGLAFALPYVMSKYLNMGVDLMEIVRACTSTPASLLKMDGQIGTLADGTCADITVLQIKEKEMVFNDIFNDQLVGTRILVPQVTICDGNILFRQIDR